MNLDTQIIRLTDIIEKISFRISIKNGLQDYFFNHLCEDIFTVTFSEIFNKKFNNINIEIPNAPGIDLISTDKEICVQISSTGTTAKLYKTLRTFLKQEEYRGCKKLYFFIIGEKEESYSEAKETVKKILEEDSVKIKGFNFDVDKDIIELKHLTKTLKDKFSDLYGNNERKLSHESLFKIVEDLSKSINGLEYALKPISENEKIEYLRNNCFEIQKSIDRRLIDEENNIFSEQDLIIKDELKYAFIYGDAGLGKTYLLNNLSFELFKNSKLNLENRLPYIINLKNLKLNISIEKQLPKYFGKRFKSILIFDGYDEIATREQLQFKILLIQYLELNKFTSCIIGSRTKIKNNEIKFIHKNGFKEKEYSFKTLRIDYFNNNEIDDFIKNKEIETSIFSDKNFQKLYSDFKNPYYLDLITRYYNDYGNLPENKLIVLDKLVNKNLIRLTSNDNRMLALETRNILEKLSFLFYYTEIKVLKDIDLAKIIEYKNEIWELLNKHDALIFNEIYEHWEISLTKQKELDFLFYSLIKKLDSKTLFEIFTEDTALPDTWYNSLLLFNNDNEISHDIRDEMTKNFPFIFIKEFQLNPNDSFFTNDLRTKVFQEIFNKYEVKDIWIDFKIFDEKSYVEFGDTDENFNFLISKVSSENQRTKSKAISLLRKFKAKIERTKLLWSIIKLEINIKNNKHIIWESYYCLSNYKDFLTPEIQRELIDLSVKSESDFLKNNEYVRASVYNFILICGLQDEYLDYFFEGLELLKFKHKNNTEGRSGTNLLDEGYNLDKVFFNLNHENSITKSFDIFFNNFSKFDEYHGEIIFNNLILKSKEILSDQKNSIQFKNKLISILSTYDLKNENWFYWKEMIINFKLYVFIIDTLKSEEKILSNLLKDKHIFNNYFHISVDGISKLITNNNYNLIINSFKNGDLSIEKVISIYDFVYNSDENLSVKIKKGIEKIGGVIPKREEEIEDVKLQDFQKKQFKLLFDENQFKKEVIDFFGEADTIDNSWSEVPNWYNESKSLYNFDFRIDYLRRFVRFENDNKFQKEKTLIVLQNNLDWVLVSLIVEKKRQYKYELTPEEENYLNKWIKEQSSKLDFRNAMSNVKNNSFSVDQNCLTIYKYIKEFDVKLDKKTNLNLLSFVDINTVNISFDENYNGYFEKLIDEINDFDAVKKRVNENLKNKVKYASILNNHIIFSYKYNILENHKLIEDLLTEFSPELQIGHFHDNPILVYFDKSKNFEFIKNNFPEDITDLFWVIINYLIDNNLNIEFAEEKLLSYIDKTNDPNKKLKFSSKLLKINSKNALKEFHDILNSVYETKNESKLRLHDFKNNIINYKNEEIEIAVKLLELSFKFDFDNFDNPRREITNYLKNMIIEDKVNYEKIKGLITSLIESHKRIIDNIQFLEFELNDLKETFYSNYKSNYSLKDALKIISNIEN